MVPNQLRVAIQKPTRYDPSKELFFSASQPALYQAMCDLSHSGLKLYLYFTTQKPSYKLELSCAAVKDKTGLSDSSYHRAVNELKDKGYLVRLKPDTFEYVFYESPVAGGLF